MEADDNQDWGQLPSAILCTIFDTIFTAPSAHPSWLAVKAQSYARLNRVCKAWKTALAETPIGQSRLRCIRTCPADMYCANSSSHAHMRMHAALQPWLVTARTACKPAKGPSLHAWRA